MDPQTWFHDKATAYVEAQMLFHLGRAGVFAALADGPATTQALADRLGLELAPLTASLEYIAGVDALLERDPSGAYGLTAFGRAVLARFGRDTPSGLRVNLFDVRVGAYGPVWAGLGGMLDGSTPYGEGVQRAGDEAATALYTVCTRMAPALRAEVQALGVQQAVEIGVTTGLLEHLSGLGLRLHGLDRDPAALSGAEARRAAAGTDPVSWIAHDLFDPAWTDGLADAGPGVLYSVHFHEILAAGEDRLVALLRALGERLPGWCVLAAEQPRLPDTDRETTPRSGWLYAQSNVLIHHLIGNGRILPDDGWRALFARAGLEPVRINDMNYLGYRSYAYRFPRR
jgi:hypothetical protein